MQCPGCEREVSATDLRNGYECPDCFSVYVPARRTGMCASDRLKWVAISIALAAVYAMLVVLPKGKR